MSDTLGFVIIAILVIGVGIYLYRSNPKARDLFDDFRDDGRLNQSNVDHPAIIAAAIQGAASVVAAANPGDFGPLPPTRVTNGSQVTSQATLDQYRAHLASTNPGLLAHTPVTYVPPVTYIPGPHDDVRTRVVPFPTVWPGDLLPMRVRLVPGTYTTTGVPKGRGWSVTGADGGYDARFNGTVGATFVVAGADGIVSFTVDKACDAHLDPH